MEHQLIMLSFGLASSVVENVPKLGAIQEVDREMTEMCSLKCPGKLLEGEVKLNAGMV